ncbi:MAG: methyltransferase domain-containing protein [Chloroflexota bacterium]|jgi:ubiquinone/menaquinone biosynthesis C-methylase UbiE
MDKQTRQTYRQIAAVFAEANQDRSPILNDMAAFAVDLPAGALVVDVGCGQGFDAALLQQQYRLRVVGLDYSHTMMKMGREQYAISVPYVQASMSQMPFAPGSLDGIWACASLLHLPRAHLPAVLAHFARLLRPNGRFYLSVKQGDDNGYARRAYGREAPRYFTYWQPETLDPLLAKAGFCPLLQKTDPAAKGPWLVRLLQLC